MRIKQDLVSFAVLFPHHRPYNIRTYFFPTKMKPHPPEEEDGLLLGTSAPKGCLYFLLPPEIEAIKQYSTASLVARII